MAEIMLRLIAEPKDAYMGLDGGDRPGYDPDATEVARLATSVLGNITRADYAIGYQVTAADKSSGMEIRLEYHSPDRVWAAVLLRSGQPWFLDGALVGMGADPAKAVADLTGIARYLVIHGKNALTEELSVGDREWLFSLLGQGAPGDYEMREAMRTARGEPL
jgi:hypothetical protein